uniref:Retrovirus-related Pol polyprotein from transposon TNT 1-94-like beta-barrel domain-containing protein n=1 Tax=Fagus sylvatica TaxID=28930 RepID=A0A2N9FDB8_FAGSY
MLEGQSTHRPPLFIGSDYGYWKNRMTMYIKAQDYHVWRVIANGRYIPTKTVERATIVKLESEWNEADVKLIELNYKAMSNLYCALDPNEYNRVSGCDSAKEVWDKLEVTYEGTNQVKESKMSMLTKRNMKYKKKALKATWDDSDESGSDNNSSDNEIANLCLLGYINESDTSEDKYASFCPLAFNDDESTTEDLCLMAHGDEVCLISKSTKDKWFLDSGCSRHITGDKNKFTSLALKDGGNVKFGDNSKGKIIGIGNIGKIFSCY